MRPKKTRKGRAKGSILVICSANPDLLARAAAKLRRRFAGSRLIAMANRTLAELVQLDDLFDTVLILPGEGSLSRAALTPSQRQSLKQDKPARAVLLYGNEDGAGYDNVRQLAAACVPESKWLAFNFRLQQVAVRPAPARHDNTKRAERHRQRRRSVEWRLAFYKNQGTPPRGTARHRCHPKLIMIDGRIYNAPDAAGIARCVSELLRAMLLLEGDEHFVLVHNRDLIPGVFDLQPLKKHPRFRTELIDAPLNDRVAEQQGLYEAIFRLRPALIHSPYFFPPLVSPAPVILTVHDLSMVRRAEFFSGAYYDEARLWLEPCIRAASALVTDSRHTAADLAEQYSIGRDAIEVIHLAADQTFTRPASTAKVTAFRRKHRLTRDYFLFVGVRRPYKNFTLLLEAFGQYVNENGDDVDLVAVGRPAVFNPEEAAIVDRLNIRERVRLLGRIGDAHLPAAYDAACALIFPSQYEGFGLPLLEAQTRGAPVVCSRAASIPEVAGRGALYVKSDKPRDWARALKRIRSDRDLRQRLIQRGYSNAKKYSWQKAAQQTLQLYRRFMP